MEEILEAISKAEMRSALYRVLFVSIFTISSLSVLSAGIFMLLNNDDGYYPILLIYGTFVASAGFGVPTFINFRAMVRKFHGAKSPKESTAFKNLEENGLYYEFNSTIDAELNDANTVCYKSDMPMQYGDGRRKGFLYLWITPAWIIVVSDSGLMLGNGINPMLGSFIQKHKNLTRVQLVMLNRNNSGIGFGFNNGGRSLISSRYNHKAILEILQKELPNVKYDL